MTRLKYAIVISIVAGLLAPALPASAQTAPPAALQKMASPVRGIAEMGYLAPKTKVEGNDVVTTFEVKNLSAGSIVGLQITEFWYDKANTPVQGTGARQRLRKPLQPGEVATIVLRSPKVPAMFRNTYQFVHANGNVKATVLKTLK